MALAYSARACLPETRSAAITVAESSSIKGCLVLVRCSSAPRSVFAFRGPKLLRTLRFPSAVMDVAQHLAGERVALVALRDGAVVEITASVLEEGKKEEVGLFEDLSLAPSSQDTGGTVQALLTVMSRGNSVAEQRGARVLSSAGRDSFVASGLLQPTTLFGKSAAKEGRALQGIDGAAPTSVTVVQALQPREVMQGVEAKESSPASKASGNGSGNSGSCSPPIELAPAVFHSLFGRHSTASPAAAAQCAVALVGDSAGAVRWAAITTDRHGGAGGAGGRLLTRLGEGKEHMQAVVAILPLLNASGSAMGLMIVGAKGLVVSFIGGKRVCWEVPWPVQDACACAGYLVHCSGGQMYATAVVTVMEERARPIVLPVAREVVCCSCCHFDDGSSMVMYMTARGRVLGLAAPVTSSSSGANRNWADATGNAAAREAGAAWAGLGGVERVMKSCLQRLSEVGAELSAVISKSEELNSVVRRLRVAALALPLLTAASEARYRAHEASEAPGAALTAGSHMRCSMVMAYDGSGSGGCSVHELPVCARLELAVSKRIECFEDGGWLIGMTVESGARVWSWSSPIPAGELKKGGVWNREIRVKLDSCQPVEVTTWLYCNLFGCGNESVRLPMGSCWFDILDFGVPVDAPSTLAAVKSSVGPGNFFDGPLGTLGVIWGGQESPLGSHGASFTVKVAAAVVRAVLRDGKPLALRVKDQMLVLRERGGDGHLSVVCSHEGMAPLVREALLRRQRQTEGQVGGKGNGDRRGGSMAVSSCRAELEEIAGDLERLVEAREEGGWPSRQQGARAAEIAYRLWKLYEGLRLESLS
ncbi:unnamed protein product [Chrysoparadoxa australica]